ncbi:MAG TPA: acetamidase/formamidase family protein [Rhodopila sp.]|uniref:acetamidase/formamidase family protein n=1 Tax=Rhodopila sp. TaxID=2480087 RepID=UPI002C963F92|nr:acetamidase/formamidase family protein [Rhodopila sp.]HVY16480.1 acetamidase/formamidase family protein [Rhodopila sp.]
MTHHTLHASPETVRLGVFNATYPPVMTIRSGDTVTVQCVSGRKDVLPPASAGLSIPPALAAILDANPTYSAGHIVTGPIAIDGAMPGDMLEIRIDAIEPGADWGYNLIRPLAGTLPEDFHDITLMHIKVDKDRHVCTLPWGTELPLAPFFGVMGVAPPPAFGTIASKEPRIHGGNLDNKELTAGSTLFLPVWVPGGNFSVGDGHGVQGDGEVCVTALEMCLTGTFTFTLHKAETPSHPLLAMPKAETPTHFISMGLNEDLDQAMKQALREMIAFITSRTNLSREQAYAFCSLAVDFHVTQTVNGEKGIHGMLKKGLLF